MNLHGEIEVQFHGTSARKKYNPLNLTPLRSDQGQLRESVAHDPKIMTHATMCETTLTLFSLDTHIY